MMAPREPIDQIIIDELKEEIDDLKRELKDAEREIRGLYHELSDSDERGY